MERKSVNQRNNQWQRHGLWEDYYPNGKLLRKGYYKNAKEVGLWIQN
jgi:antitoxin component YwqK of YwqJK toxin-antitoxin module